MNISYAIPVCNEHEELSRLLTFLSIHIDQEDEIVVQCDQGNTTQEVHRVLGDFPKVRIVEFPLKGDFASFKNNLKENCSKDWIFQIDADEVPHEYLIKNLKDVLKTNPNTELFLVPRINTVEGLTQDHIDKWGWKVNELGWVNFPDYQTRILQNGPKIKWGGKVHEVVLGHDTFAGLPNEEEWCLYHHKNIDRQEHQNKFYDTL